MLPSPAQQIESRRRLDGIFRAHRLPAPIQRPKPRPFVEDKNAPRCKWPRAVPLRDWLLISESDNRRPTIKQITNSVCLYFDVTKTDIVSQRRTARVVRPRQIAMYLARTLTLHSLPVISKNFGDRDHTTALHACQMIASRQLFDPVLKQQIEDLRRMIEGQG